jgi:hypothetical protein
MLAAGIGVDDIIMDFRDGKDRFSLYFFDNHKKYLKIRLRLKVLQEIFKKEGAAADNGKIFIEV